MNDLLIRVLALGFLPGLLISCDRKKPSSRERVENHFNQVDEKKNAVQTKIERYFKNTDYSFEVSNVAVGGVPLEGKVKAEDLTAMRFTSMIWVEGAETLAKAEEVDRGLREIFTSEEVDKMTIYYQTGMEGEKQIVMTLKSMRGTRDYLKEQGVPSPVFNQ
ncbi:hypothetical protein N9Y81_03805 [Akkermansiaceae bacterium]|jgi:hypothetical protein|nr:hypothetical protein [Akkermansiaceae bacterium]